MPLQHDPFKLASATVTDMQAQHDKLERAIPHLQELEKSVQENVDALNRRQTQLMGKLEGLTAEISRRTAAFNVWLKQQRDDLAAEIHVFSLHKEAKEAELATEQEKVDNIKTGQMDIAIRQAASFDKIKEDRELLDARLEVQSKAETIMAEREQKAQEQEKQNSQTVADLATKSIALDKRDEDTASNNRKAQIALDEAETARSSANTLLESAKDKIAEVDAKETELLKRDALQDQRQGELDLLSIQLNDRRGVIESHAKLIG